MNQIITQISTIFHIDTTFLLVFKTYDQWTYAILFMIIFAETGLVVMPFLPGDSLLFVAGTLAASHILNPWITGMGILIAAIAGNTVNYSIGRKFSDAILTSKRKWVSQSSIDKTHAYFAQYGKSTLIISRFLPVFRTIAPFIAGAAKMDRHNFMVYNIVGAALWTFLLYGGGYWFGNFPFVKNNFSMVIAGILILSFLPLLWSLIDHIFIKKPKN